ncbi:MAG TPA: hypothetical protein VGH87_17905, partial [Polyangiaceae bacterium]
MKRIALLSSIIVVAGCSTYRAPAIAEAPIALHAKVVPMTFDSIDDQENPYVAQSTDTRNVGDWVTTEFANAAGKATTVQQRVLSRDGAASIVEVQIKDGKTAQIFRMRTQTTRAGEQVLDVTKVDGGIEHATTLASYEAAMQKTVPSVDRNDGMLDVEPVTVDLGTRKIEAVRTTYKVVVNGKPATMSVIHNDGFAWGDLGGEIITESGKKLYST